MSSERDQDTGRETETESKRQRARVRELEDKERTGHKSAFTKGKVFASLLAAQAKESACRWVNDEVDQRAVAAKCIHSAVLADAEVLSGADGAEDHFAVCRQHVWRDGLRT